MKLRGLICGAALVGGSILCMAASGGCGTPLHKAEISAGAIAASLHTAAETNHTNQLETADERKMVAQYIVDAAAANDDFIGVLKNAEAKGGTPDTAAIAAAFRGLVARVDELNSQGVLQLKSPQAQANFALVISSIRAELATVQALYPTLAAGNSHPWLARGGIQGALVFTGAEIEELIALAIAAGSELVPKLMALKGQSGADILAEAEADDLAAEELAEEDGAKKPEDENPEPKPAS